MHPTTPPPARPSRPPDEHSAQPSGVPGAGHQQQDRPSRLGRRERRRAETRGKLFRTAMQLFAERGFFETTTEHITEAADVGRGTFFNYFPSKYHVLTVLSDIQLHKIMAAQEEAETGHSAIRDVLHRLMHSLAEELGHSPALTRSLLTAFLASDTVRTLINTTMRDGRAGLTRIIALGQRRGEIRRDQPAVESALLYQQEVVGTLLLWGMQGEDSLPSRLESTFRHFWAAVAAED